MNKTYSIKAKVWLYDGKDPWHFVSISKNISKEINFYFAHLKRGWNSLPVNVTLGKTNWTTSIFFDKKADAYLLPLKAEVRKNELVKEGDMVSLSVEIKA